MAVVKRLFRRLSRWRPVRALLERVESFFFEDVVDPAVHIPAPVTTEMEFMRLHAEGRFEEMWGMLADDAQRAWGGIQNFIREMPRLEEWIEILDMQAASVTVLDTWTDHVHDQTYSNVAQLVMRYRVRQQWKEWTFDRQVHLIPAGGGWRTLCYPMRTGVAATR